MLDVKLSRRKIAPQGKAFAFFFLVYNKNSFVQLSTCGTKYVTTYNVLNISHVIYNSANASEPKTAEQYIL